ncbi:glycine-rich cell wall structural protein 1.0 [Sphaeramia orbicularis]|uniref:glycine-rich cell wall structural protein 1.0 n=1 Tax=Sphaeramia orbicularis TaxID=375764 RepID=UPI0011805FD3|nr:glycine-rich cell wall structural protein 1.0-like [Sphaeramia orbicularis]
MLYVLVHPSIPEALCSFSCSVLASVSSIMLVRALLQTSLLLWLAQQTLQGGVKPQSVSWGRVLPARGVGIGVKPGVGRYPTAALGVGGYRSLGLGGRTGLKQGTYGTQGAYGASLGTGMGLTNGLGLGGKRVYGTGMGTLPGYGTLAGMGYPGARQGYLGGPGNYLGASLGAGGYGAGLGQGAYLGGAAGKLNGYGDGVTGYLGAMAGNGYGADTGGKVLSTGYGNGYGDSYGAALSTGAYAGQVQGGAYGALGTGLDPTGGKYGGGAAQLPYGGAPVIPTGLEGDGAYPYAAQHLSLEAESAKAASKYGAGVPYGPQQTGYGAQLGATQDALDEPAKYGGNGGLATGYKG